MTNKPNPFPCGGPGQPACPPTPAAAVGAVMNLTPEERQQALDAHQDHPHHHFWQKFFDDLGNAIGEAKFGGQ